MSYFDMSLLGRDPTFVARVQAALVGAAVGVQNEAVSAANHYKKLQFAASILANPASYGPLFAASVATDPTVISDATQNGTIPLSSANVAAQALLVTDAHIINAIGAQATAYFSPF